MAAGARWCRWRANRRNGRVEPGDAKQSHWLAGWLPGGRKLKLQADVGPVEPGGSSGIRTLEPLRVAGFQDRCNRPLCQASEGLTKAVILGCSPTQTVLETVVLTTPAVRPGRCLKIGFMPDISRCGLASLHLDTGRGPGEWRLGGGALSIEAHRLGRLSVNVGQGARRVSARTRPTRCSRQVLGYCAPSPALHANMQRRPRRAKKSPGSPGLCLRGKQPQRLRLLSCGDDGP